MMDSSFSLDFTGKTLDVDAFEAIETRISSSPDKQPLIRLNLSMCKIGVEGAARLSSMLERHSSETSLADLDVSWNDLGTEGAAKIAALLHKNVTIRRLALANNRIGPDGVCRIADALDANCALKSLDLSGDEVGDDGAPRLAASLERNRALTRLDLQVNSIGDRGAESIAAALRTNRTLSALVLSYNDIGDRGMREVAAALADSGNSSLVELHAWANSIGDGGALGVADLIEANETLLRIDLSDNKLTEASAGRLVVALEKNTSLTQLDLRGAGFSDASIARIQELLERNQAAVATLFEDCKRGDIGSIRKALDSSGARVYHLINSSKKGLLQYACECGQVDCAAALLSHFVTKLGVFPDIEEVWSADEVGTLIKAIAQLEPTTLEAKDSAGETILHWVAESAMFSPEAATEAVRLLLAAGCLPDSRSTSRGATPLMCARSSAAAAVLLESDADDLACDCFGNGCKIKKYASQDKRAPTLFVLTGGAGCSGLPDITLGTAVQFITSVSGQAPWWRTSLVAPRTLPVGCFPLVAFKTRSGATLRARLCDFEFLERPTLSETESSNVILLHVYAPEHGSQMKAFWHQVDLCSRAYRAAFPRASSVVAGFGHCGYCPPEQLVVHLADVHAESQLRGIHAHGEFPLDNPFSLLEICRAFHERRTRTQKEGPFHLAISTTAFLREVRPPLAAEAAFRTVRVVYAGPASSGKTSLLQRLKHKAFAMKKSLAPPEPTICVDHKRMELKRAALVVSDFSGFPEYSIVQELFLSTKNSVYVLVFDGSSPMPILSQQIGDTLLRLRSHPRGPRNSCRLLIFCSKLDKLGEKDKGTSQAVRERQETLRQHVEMLLTGQPVRWDLVFVSSKLDTTRYRKCVKDQIVEIRKIPLPGPYCAMYNAFLKLTMPPFASVNLFRSVLPPEVLEQLDSTGTWADALCFMRDMGMLCFSDSWEGPEDERVICLDMSLLARALAAFVAPQAHLDRISPGGKFEARKCRMPAQEFEQRLQTASNFESQQLSLFVTFLQQLHFCYAKMSNYVIPHLLPRCDGPCLPPARDSDHRGVVLRVKGVGWRCLSCGFESAGQVPSTCPNCAKAGKCEAICKPLPECAPCAKSGRAEIPEFLLVKEAKPDGTRICLGAGEKVSFVEISPDCACVQPYAGFGFLAESAPLQGGRIGFSRLLCSMHEWLDDSFSIAANAFVAKDLFGNILLVSEKTEDRIQVAIRGTAPFLWRRFFPQLSGSSEPLCPYCIQGGAFTPIAPAAVPKSPRLASPRRVPTVRLCSRGHAVDDEVLAFGAPPSQQMARGAWPWSPVDGAHMYDETEKKRAWRNGHGGLRTTSLVNCDAEVGSRKAELLRAEAAFFAFLGSDSRSKFELRRVTLIDNPVLEAAFEKAHSRMLLRSYLSQQDGNCSAGKLNLALGWQGLTQKEARRVAAKNFVSPSPKKARERKGDDEREDGAAPFATQQPTAQSHMTGVAVFTFQSPQWALQCARGAAEKKGDDDDEGRKKKKSHNPDHALPPAYMPAECLIASWVLQGTVGNSRQFMSGQADSSSVSVPQDGVSVRSVDQVLPRYVFHYNSFVSALREDLRAAQLVLLLVDDMSKSDEYQAILKSVSETISRDRRFVIEQMSSSSELLAWLCKYGFKIPAKLRIATNSFRESDGQEAAAERVVNVVREEVGNDVPCLVFGFRAKHGNGHHSSAVFYTEDKSKLSEFCVNGKL